jgi:hypothetical protein
MKIKNFVEKDTPLHLFLKFALKCDEQKDKMFELTTNEMEDMCLIKITSTIGDKDVLVFNFKEDGSLRIVFND